MALGNKAHQAFVQQISGSVLAPLLKRNSVKRAQKDTATAYSRLAHHKRTQVGSGVPNLYEV